MVFEVAAGLVLVAGTPAAASGWQRWQAEATSVALAAGEADPAQIAAACAAAQRAVAGLPAWTRGVAPYCRAVHALTSHSELPTPLWRRVCVDGRRAVALLRQAEGSPGSAAARRLIGVWEREFAASCPAVIPPPG